MRKVSVDRLKLAEIKRRLRVQCGFEKDEIEQLYPTEEKAREAYTAFLQAAEAKEAPAESEQWAEDDYQLPDDAKKVADALEQEEKEIASQRQQFKQMQTAASMVTDTMRAEAEKKTVTELGEKLKKKPAKKKVEKKKKKK